jgi:hypothetical protein
LDLQLLVQHGRDLQVAVSQAASDVSVGQDHSAILKPVGANVHARYRRFGRAWAIFGRRVGYRPAGLK